MTIADEPTRSSIQPMVSVDGVTIAYGPVVIARSISLSIRPGEIYSIIGRSGCGKTSLLNLIAGFVRPAEGTLTVGGKAVTRPGPDRMVVFQDFDQLFPWKSAAGNIDYALTVTGVAKGERVAETRRWLKAVGLLDKANSYPNQLSGGQKQRVALARCLAMRPDVVLLDEPFASLDAQTRRELQPLLRRALKERGAAALLITHDIAEALRVGDIVGVMQEGGDIIEVDVSGLEDHDGDGGAVLMAELTSRLEELI